MCEARPNMIEDIRVTEPNVKPDTEDARAQLAAVKKGGLVNTERFFLHQLFIAGLRYKLRSKIM